MSSSFPPQTTSSPRESIGMRQRLVLQFGSLKSKLQQQHGGHLNDESDTLPESKRLTLIRSSLDALSQVWNKRSPKSRHQAPITSASAAKNLIEKENDQAFSFVRLDRAHKPTPKPERMETTRTMPSNVAKRRFISENDRPVIPKVQSHAETARELVASALDGGYPVKPKVRGKINAKTQRFSKFRRDSVDFEQDPAVAWFLFHGRALKSRPRSRLLQPQYLNANDNEESDDLISHTKLSYARKRSHERALAIHQFMSRLMDEFPAVIGPLQNGPPSKIKMLVPPPASATVAQLYRGGSGRGGGGRLLRSKSAVIDEDDIPLALLGGKS
ncbi:hypothetical protein BDR26DRAFT_848747 [Obelidium mucronatum]|nr:hypothetical protein BDR26DRAFT_848747 [Obelidium mucronatum]